MQITREKRIEIGHSHYIYGIGDNSADKILAQAGVNPDIRVRDLTDDDVKKISAVIDETMMVEGDLRREIALNIKRLRNRMLQEVSVIVKDFSSWPRRPKTTQNNAKVLRTVANKKIKSRRRRKAS